MTHPCQSFVEMGQSVSRENVGVTYCDTTKESDVGLRTRSKVDHTVFCRGSHDVIDVSESCPSIPSTV